MEEELVPYKGNSLEEEETLVEEDMEEIMHHRRWGLMGITETGTADLWAVVVVDEKKIGYSMEPLEEDPERIMVEEPSIKDY